MKKNHKHVEHKRKMEWSTPELISLNTDKTATGTKTAFSTTEVDGPYTDLNS